MWDKETVLTKQSVQSTAIFPGHVFAHSVTGSVATWERVHRTIWITMEMDRGHTRDMESKSEHFISFLGSWNIFFSKANGDS